MKNKYTVFALALLPFSHSLTASEWNVAVDPFFTSGSYVFAGDGLDFRFAELATLVPQGENAATHILVHGMVPSGADTNVYMSGYEAIDLSTGAVQDLGMFYVNLPASALDNAPALSSPIVGISPRQGAWSAFSPGPPSQTTLGGARGSGTVSDGHLQLEINRNGQTGSASIPVSFPDGDTMVLQAFTATLGGNTHSFAETTLVRDGARYYGAITATDMVDYDSRMFAIELTEGAPAGVVLQQGRWATDSRLGDLYGVDVDLGWGYSAGLGWMNVASFPWIYQAKAGWIHYSSGGPGQPLWFFSQDLGWIHVPVSRDGTYRYSAGDWATASFL